jgi:hypothetical protein
MVSGGPVKERKERTGWESGEKMRETARIGEEDSSLHSGPESEPGKSCCCCDSRELESNLQAPTV